MTIPALATEEVCWLVEALEYNPWAKPTLIFGSFLAIYVIYLMTIILAESFLPKEDRITGFQLFGVSVIGIAIAVIPETAAAHQAIQDALCGDLGMLGALLVQVIVMGMSAKEVVLQLLLRGRRRGGGAATPTS